MQKSLSGAKLGRTFASADIVRGASVSNFCTFVRDNMDAVIMGG